MTEPRDPERWADGGSDAPPSVRAVMERCRTDVGTAAEVRALEVSLSSILGPAAPGGVAGASKAGLAKVGAAAVLATCAGAAWLWLAAPLPGGGSAAGTQASAPVAPAEPALPEQPAERDEAPASVVAPSEPSLEPPGVGTPPGASEPAAPSRPRERTEAAPPRATEAELLGGAQRALAASPGRALSLAGEHARLFPGGVLSQEREVLAIEALSRLGRMAEAKTRAERFLRTFPRSAHRTKVLNLVR